MTKFTLEWEPSKMVEDDTDLLITYFEWMALMQKGDGNDGEPDVLKIKKLEMDCIRMLSEVSQTICKYAIPINFWHRCLLPLDVSYVTSRSLLHMEVGDI